MRNDNMSGLLVEDRNIVFPGDIVAQGMDYLPSGDIVRIGDSLISTKIGLISLNNRIVKLIPLTGPYLPKRHDTVIGCVVSIGMSGWRLDIRWPFEANLGLAEGSSEFIQRNSDLSRYYGVGDYVRVEITNVA